MSCYCTIGIHLIIPVHTGLFLYLEQDEPFTRIVTQQINISETADNQNYIMTFKRFNVNVSYLRTECICSIEYEPSQSGTHIPRNSHKVFCALKHNLKKSDVMFTLTSTEHPAVSRNKKVPQNSLQQILLQFGNDKQIKYCRHQL